MPVAFSLGTALALILFAAARDPITALAASLIAGLAWITALVTINVAAQMAAAMGSWARPVDLRRCHVRRDVARQCRRSQANLAEAQRLSHTGI